MAPLLSTRSVPLNDSGHAIVAINIILAFIATMTCAARFWARKLTGLNWSWDDWLALASLLVNHAFMAITVNAAFHGLGQSMTVLLETSPASIPVFLKVCTLSFFFSPFCLVSVQTELLFLFLPGEIGLTISHCTTLIAASVSSPPRCAMASPHP